MLRLEPVREGRAPPTDWMGNAGGPSPRDGANTELVTLEVCIPAACYGVQAAQKQKTGRAAKGECHKKQLWWHHALAARIYARRGERGDRQPSRTGEEQTTPES